VSILKVFPSSAFIAITFSVLSTIQGMDEGMDDERKELQLDRCTAALLRPADPEREWQVRVKSEILLLKEVSIKACIDIYAVLRKSNSALKLEKCSIDVKGIYSRQFRSFKGLISHFNADGLAAIEAIREQQRYVEKITQINEKGLRRFYEERHSGTLRTQVPKTDQSIPADSYQEGRQQLTQLIGKDIREFIHLYYELHGVTYPAWKRFSKLDKEKACCFPF
jgi:hypothetical protein